MLKVTAAVLITNFVFCLTAAASGRVYGDIEYGYNEITMEIFDDDSEEVREYYYRTKRLGVEKDLDKTTKFKIDYIKNTKEYYKTTASDNYTNRYHFRLNKSLTKNHRIWVAYKYWQKKYINNYMKNNDTNTGEFGISLRPDDLTLISLTARIQNKDYVSDGSGNYEDQRIRGGILNVKRKINENFLVDIRTRYTKRSYSSLPDKTHRSYRAGFEYKF